MSHCQIHAVDEVKKVKKSEKKVDRDQRGVLWGGSAWQQIDHTSIHSTLHQTNAHQRLARGFLQESRRPSSLGFGTLRFTKNCCPSWRRQLSVYIVITSYDYGVIAVITA